MSWTERTAATGGGSANAILNINVGGDWASGDLAQFAIYTESNTDVLPTPDGTTLIDETVRTNTTPDIRQETFWAIHDGRSSYTFDPTGTPWIAVVMSAWVHSSGNPLDANPLDTFGEANGSSATPGVSAGITVATNDSLLVCSASNFSGNNTTAGTSGMDLTARINATATFWKGVNAGATGSITLAISSAQWVAHLIAFKPPSGGGAAVLEGSSAGTSTAGATALQLPHALAAASAGTSTAGADLLTAKPLVGASAGTSTAAADLLTAKPLVGATAGTSTAGATLALPHALVGSSAGTSTADADLSVVSGAGAVLEGSSAGTSTAGVDTLRLNHALAASTAGTSTAGADTLRLNHALVASSAGASTAGADLLTAKPLVGSSAGTSTAGVDTLRLTHPLTASAAGTSTAAATLRMLHALSGAAAGTSTAEAALNIPLGEVAGLLVSPAHLTQGEAHATAMPAGGAREAIMSNGGARAIVMSNGGATPSQRRIG